MFQAHRLPNCYTSLPRKRQKYISSRFNCALLVPVLPPVETEDEIDDNHEPQEGTQELQSISELFNVNLEDAELLLDNNVTHDALQEDEV